MSQATMSTKLPAAVRRKAIKLFTDAVNEGRLTQIDVRREPVEYDDGQYRHLFIAAGARTYYTAHFWVQPKQRKPSPKPATRPAGNRKR